MHGAPAAGMGVAFYATGTAEDKYIKRFTLNQDGRNPDGLLFSSDELQIGSYKLVFDVAGYFRQRGVLLPEPAFLNLVSIDFGVADLNSHYHVPLLVTPWSYSTYRGS
jgi:5-hydroxyisourate hydrolase